MDNAKKYSYKMLLLFGIASLFADMTYEGARGIIGPYMQILGASPFVVSLSAGFGEFIGYAFRLVVGYLSDRTGLYWGMSIFGYFVNMFSVPLFAFVPSWPWAVILIFSERLGKSIRTPPRDVLISSVVKKIGMGYGFGIHEFLDQTGALIGPILVSVILFTTDNYKIAFLTLLIPAITTMISIFYAKANYKDDTIESNITKDDKFSLKITYYLYLLAYALIAMGYADFALLAYHIKQKALMSDAYIPIFYAISSGVIGVFALIFGAIFDKLGLYTVFLGIGVALPFPILAFSNNPYSILIGVILWSIGMGTQEAIPRSAIAKLVSIEQRGKAYGLFHFFYGLFWFIGSAIIGYLYQISILYLVIFSIACQTLAFVPLFIVSRKTFVAFKNG